MNRGCDHDDDYDDYNTTNTTAKETTFATPSSNDKQSTSTRTTSKRRSASWHLYVTDDLDLIDVDGFK